MQQTLFLIPHSWFEGPLLIGWLIFGAVVLLATWFRKGTAESMAHLPFLLLGAAAIWFILPAIEIEGVDPQNPTGPFVKVGLAIRGYGVCLLLAMVGGIGVSILRARQVGISSDRIISLAFWMIVAGIIGARLFYVIQKSDEFFPAPSFGTMLLDLVNMTKGGLVVYGSLIGGTIAAFIYFRIYRLPVLQTADVIAPGMALGLAIGRIGCLMNGCCFGGVCDIEGLPKSHFPAGSPPYMQQLVNGTLIGVTSERSETFYESIQLNRVTGVERGSLAEQKGIERGDEIGIIPTIDDLRLRHLKSVQANSEPDWDLELPIISTRQGTILVQGTELPERSVGVHPTQIYAAVDAFLLSLVLWFFWYIKRTDGQVFALMLMLHSISRFMLEIVRHDELGVFGTELTISQWISVLLLMAGIVLFFQGRVPRPQSHTTC